MGRTSPLPNLHLSPAEIETLILIQLADFGDMGFNKLLSEIHEFQRKHSDPKQYNPLLSRRSYSKYLKSLVSEGIVKMKKQETGIREIYSYEYDCSGELIEPFCDILSKFEADNSKPFFNLIELLQKIEKENELENLENTMALAVKNLHRYNQFRKLNPNNPLISIKKPKITNERPKIANKIPDRYVIRKVTEKFGSVLNDNNETKQRGKK